MATLKKKATDQSASLPSQILKDLNLADVPAEVSAHLPDMLNIKQTLVRHRAKEVPPNPRIIDELEYIPRKYSVTKSGEAFLLYDSANDEDEEINCGRIIIYSTEENLRRLFQSRLWTVDGTFKSSPSIFYQLFTLMGTVTYRYNDRTKTIHLPLVYALLENKREAAYLKVLNVVMTEAEKLRIPANIPECILSDFEVAIMNTLVSKFGDIVKGCFFHLRQIVHRHIQEEGLQRAYTNEDDDSIRNAAHMLCAIAFVPVNQVEKAFDELKAVVPAQFSVIMDFFEVQ